MNVEFEPSLSHIRVNELMNVTPNANVSVSPYVHKHLLCMFCVCALLFILETISLYNPVSLPQMMWVWQDMVRNSLWELFY